MTLSGSDTIRLSPRHSEILLLLASAPRGLSGDELLHLLCHSHRADVARSRRWTAALLAMVAGSVEARYRGGFMNVNSAFQQMASGLAAMIAGANRVGTPIGLDYQTIGGVYRTGASGSAFAT